VSDHERSTTAVGHDHLAATRKTIVKHILIVSPEKSVTPHFETELEIAEEHLTRGDKVSVMSCHGELAVCDFNLYRDSKECLKCRAKRSKGWSLVSGQVCHLPLCDKIEYPYRTTQMPAAKTPEQLKNWRVNGADLGWGVLSSLVSARQTPSPDLQKDRWLLQRFAASSERIYNRLVAVLKTNRFDVVYIFNGRLASARAVVRACEETQTNYCVHERGCNNKHYALFHNALPHSIDYNTNDIMQAWQQAENLASRSEIASAWFIGRRNRSERDWFSFTKHQKAEQLPADWDGTKHNVVIFTSSEDEFVSIGDMWVNKVYMSQLEGIVRIASDLDVSCREAFVTVRMHPNQRRLSGGETLALRKLRLPNVRVIPPESAVDSYALIDKASVVVTFGSTVGIESVFWNTPAVLLGPSFYQNLGAVHAARTHEDGLQNIIRPVLGDRQMALAYGFWANTRGKPYKYFEASDFFEGSYRGTRLNEKVTIPIHKRLLYSVEKRMRILHEKVFYWL
jgi:hypothetical protein